MQLTRVPAGPQSRKEVAAKKAAVTEGGEAAPAQGDEAPADAPADAAPEATEEAAAEEAPAVAEPAAEETSAAE